LRSRRSVQGSCKRGSPQPSPGDGESNLRRTLTDSWEGRRPDGRAVGQRSTGRTETDVADRADSTQTSVPRATGTADLAASFSGCPARYTSTSPYPPAGMAVTTDAEEPTRSPPRGAAASWSLIRARLNRQVSQPAATPVSTPTAVAPVTPRPVVPRVMAPPKPSMDTKPAMTGSDRNPSSMPSSTPPNRPSRTPSKISESSSTTRPAIPRPTNQFIRAPLPLDDLPPLHRVMTGGCLSLPDSGSLYAFLMPPSPGPARSARGRGLKSATWSERRGPRAPVPRAGSGTDAGRAEIFARPRQFPGRASPYTRHERRMGPGGEGARPAPGHVLFDRAPLAAGAVPGQVGVVQPGAVLAQAASQAARSRRRSAKRATACVAAPVRTTPSAASRAQPMLRLRTSPSVSGACVASPSVVTQIRSGLSAGMPGGTSAVVVRVRPSRVTTLTSAG